MSRPMLELEFLTIAAIRAFNIHEIFAIHSPLAVAKVVSCGAILRDRDYLVASHSAKDTQMCIGLSLARCVHQKPSFG